AAGRPRNTPYRRLGAAYGSLGEAGGRGPSDQIPAGRPGRGWGRRRASRRGPCGCMGPLPRGENAAVSAQGSAPAGRGVPGGIVQQFDRSDLPAVETEELRESERTPLPPPAG